MGARPPAHKLVNLGRTPHAVMEECITVCRLPGSVCKRLQRLRRHPQRRVVVCHPHPRTHAQIEGLKHEMDFEVPKGYVWDGEVVPGEQCAPCCRRLACSNALASTRCVFRTPAPLLLPHIIAPLAACVELDPAHDVSRKPRVTVVVCYGRTAAAARRYSANQRVLGACGGCARLLHPPRRLEHGQPVQGHAHLWRLL